MKYAFILVTLCLLANSQFAYSASYDLSAAFWASPRTAKAVSQMEPINNVLQDWQNRSKHHLQILYPGGEEGELWANELRDWLITLGVPYNKIMLNAGSAFEDKIQIVIVP